MSTFSGLNAAYSGLVAARQGLDVVGQNIVNAGTEGYTRQRVQTSAVGALGASTSFSLPRPGDGVAVTGIARLGDVYLDDRVQAALGQSSYWNTMSTIRDGLEASLNEPGENGLSSQLHSFWGAWQDLANQSGESAPASVLLEQGRVLASQIADGYHNAQAQWSSTRAQAEGMVGTLNATAEQIARLNGQIRSTIAAGGSANELIDQRSVLVEQASALAGATVVYNDDNTVNVIVGGSPLVAGTTARQLELSGASTMEAAAADPVALVWSHRPGQPVPLDAGQLGAALAAMAPAATDGSRSGGAIAEQAEMYNRMATALADAVNPVHEGGVTPGGSAGGPFFAVASTGPAALGLSVVPSDVSQIATALPGEGGKGGGNADLIAQIGAQPGSPDDLWAGFVVATGVATSAADQQYKLSSQATTIAQNLRSSQSAVDTDEELTNMLALQRAYQGAARVMTAVDEALDVLINHTGLVGR